MICQVGGRSACRFSGQMESREFAFKEVEPVLFLLLYLFTLKQVILPQGKINILRWQRGQDSALVKIQQFMDDNRDGQAIGNTVMDVKKKQVAVILQAHQC